MSGQRLTIYNEFYSDITRKLNKKQRKNHSRLNHLLLSKTYFILYVDTEEQRLMEVYEYGSDQYVEN